MSADALPSSPARLLVALQDLEEMISEAEDGASRRKLEAMGFPVTGLDRLREAREALEAQIAPQLLGRFRRLTERAGRAVVPVVGNCCTGCFSSLPPSYVSSTHAQRVLACEACGRILYWP